MIVLYRICGDVLCAFLRVPPSPVLALSLTWAMAVLPFCYQSSVLPTAVPATSSYPTPGPLMSTPLINTGQPTLYQYYYHYSY